MWGKDSKILVGDIFGIPISNKKKSFGQYIFWVGLGIGGALGGASNYLSNDQSCSVSGLLSSMGQGAQVALDSPVGQAAVIVATLGSSMPQKNNLNLSGHAVGQMIERNIDEARVIEALSKGMRSSGNTPNTTMFTVKSSNASSGRGLEVVINDITGKIITTIDKGSNFNTK